MECNRPPTIKVDIEAFNQLFREHYPALRAYAGMLVDDVLAEDFVQDIFLYTWESRQNISIHASIKAYLFKAVHNRCLNHFSHQDVMADKHQQILHELQKQEILQADPEKNPVIQKLFMNELRQEIHEAINNLPYKCREVFKLSYIEDYKNKQISQLMGISVSTVEKHINHALKSLRKSLHQVRSIFMQFL